MTLNPKASRSRAQVRGAHWWLIILGGVAGIAGYFGPWVAHRAAGLVVIGLDLAEYVKFLPPVMSGQIQLQRELFYVPLLTASLSASLLAARRALPGWARLLLALAAIPLALAMLPPAWSPASLRSPEYRLQVLAIFICLAMIPAVVVTRYLPRRLMLAVIALLALAAAIVPTRLFLLVQPAIAVVYHRPLSLGWGFWANLFGFLAVAVVAAADALAPAHGPAPDRERL